ncbi:MAG: hypothetical protein HYZ32_02630, partial [Hydrocarboniphaga effusa]|nr:hypothetical protein [Hydrocarboniphaga effusa]
MKNTKVNWRTAIILGVGLAASAPATARDPFQITISINSVEQPTLGFSGVEDAIDSVEPDELRRLFDYSEGDAVFVSLDFRGLATTLNFGANDDVLTFIVPGIISETVDGSGPQGSDLARKDALDQLADRLKDKPDL